MLTRTFMVREKFESQWKDMPVAEFRRVLG